MKQAGQVGTDWTARPGAAALFPAVRRSYDARYGVAAGPSQTNSTSATFTETTRSIPAWREITMSRIPRIGRDVRPCSAHGASPPGTGDPRASQPSGQEPHLVSRLGGDSLVGRFIQHVAAGATVAAGQNRPAPAITHSRWRTITTPRLLPHTVQLCIHCRQNPARFWISHTSDQTARRPWCLCCCRDLDPACHHIKPFDIQYLQQLSLTMREPNQRNSGNRRWGFSWPSSPMIQCTFGSILDIRILAFPRPSV